MSKYTIINMHDTVAIRRNPPTCYSSIEREPVFIDNDSESVRDYCQVVVFFVSIVLVSIALHGIVMTIL
jgi:hypothetical protein